MRADINIDKAVSEVNSVRDGREQIALFTSYLFSRTGRDDPNIPRGWPSLIVDRLRKR